MSDEKKSQIDWEAARKVSAASIAMVVQMLDAVNTAKPTLKRRPTAKRKTKHH